MPEAGARAHVAAIRERLEAVATPERAVKEKAYLKSDLEFLGATVPQTRQAAREFRAAHSDMPIADLRAVVRALWEPPVHELRMVGIALLELWSRKLVAEDLKLVEELLRQANTWAQVDWLAANVAGALVERYSELEATLERWAVDENFWLRRSALLALLVAMREGRGNFPLFARLAAPMLPEKEFFIRKAIGWILRDVSRKRPELTIAFLDDHLMQASPLTVREATRHLEADERDRLLARRGLKVPAS